MYAASPERKGETNLQNRGWVQLAGGSCPHRSCHVSCRPFLRLCIDRCTEQNRRGVLRVRICTAASLETNKHSTYLGLPLRLACQLTAYAPATINCIIDASREHAYLCKPSSPSNHNSDKPGAKGEVVNLVRPLDGALCTGEPALTQASNAHPLCNDGLPLCAWRYAAT